MSSPRSRSCADLAAGQSTSQRLPDPGRNDGRIEPFAAGFIARAGTAERPPWRRQGSSVRPVQRSRRQLVTYPAGRDNRPGGPRRPRMFHPVLGKQGGDELTQVIEVEVSVAIQVNEIDALRSRRGRAAVRPARTDCQRPAAGWRRRPAARQHRQLGQRLGDLPPVPVTGRLIQRITPPQSAAGGQVGRAVTSSSVEAARLRPPGQPMRSGRHQSSRFGRGTPALGRHVPSPHQERPGPRRPTSRLLADRSPLAAGLAAH